MKKILVMVMAWMCLFSCQDEQVNIYAVHAKEDVSQIIDGWKLIWSEEFDQYSSLFDQTSWSYAPKGNSDWSRYLSESSDQAYVQNGRLILRAEKKNGEYKTGGVRTKDKVGFKYGKLDVCAKFNSFQGGWPAIWLLPVKRQYPDPTETEYQGEIDMMEHVSLGENVWHTVHSHYTRDLGFKIDPPASFSAPFLHDEFNLYTLEWTAEEIKFFINGEETFSYPNLHLENEAEMKQWPFDVPYYLILNYAVGGEWPGEIDDNGLPGQMEVEYVRYYQKLEESGGSADPEPDPEPGPNLISNGDFEVDFDAEHALGTKSNGDKDAIVSLVDKWFMKNRGGVALHNLVLDTSVGANESSRSLKYESSFVSKVWDVDISYVIKDVPEGTYTFSYYVKTNKASSSFLTSIGVYENEDDLTRVSEKQKIIVLDGDKQTLEINTASRIYGTTISKASDEWKQYTVTVKIPQNIYVRFYFKPCITGEPKNYWVEDDGEGVEGIDNIVYWFDDFSFRRIN